LSVLGDKNLATSHDLKTGQKVIDLKFDQKKETLLSKIPA